MDTSEKIDKSFSLLARELKSIAVNNINYFQNGKNSHQAKFHVTFCLLHDYLDIGIEPSYLELCKHLTLCNYDFSEQIKGNGYRSLLKVVNKCCLHLLQLCKYITSVRESILFRKKFYAKELESYVSALGQLRGVLYYSLKLINYCSEGELFADEERLNNEVADQLVLDVESLCQEPFYGRCLGFQFCDSMYKPVQALAIAMASYSEGYLETSQMMQVASSVFNSGKYFLDPELRAQQVVKVTRTADIKFCKAFWGFSESGIMRQLPMFVCPAVEVNEMITLGPDAFKMPLVDSSDTVDITPPCAHTGPGHVHARLISAHLRDGQHALRKSSKVKSPPAAKPKAAGLVIHIHGGGFVAQSSKSHEVYLREWAVSVDAPILSVDYSLAPEYPFPRALEECFYAYAWAVSNCEQLGSSGEKILIAGDSAGGNLAIATAMRAASFGIRSPDCVFCVYPCTVVRYTPSPARLLSLLDPILPVGLVSRCLAAYAGVNEEHPLSTPKMDDVHSQKSLTRLHLGTYETQDSEWLIIDGEGSAKRDISSITDTGTDQDTSGSKSHNAILEMNDKRFKKSESMFNIRKAEDAPDRPITCARRQSDTEIFSQLASDGSCILGGAGGKPPIDPSDSSSEVLSASHLSGLPKDGGTFNLDRLQKKAKLVMESAHSLFSSLTSFIPSSQEVSSSFRSKMATKQLAASSQTSLHSQHSMSNELNLFTISSTADDNHRGNKNPIFRSDNSSPTSVSPSLQAGSFDLENDASMGGLPAPHSLEIKNMEAGINNSNIITPDAIMSPASTLSQIDSSLSFTTALTSPISPYLEQRIQDLGNDLESLPVTSHNIDQLNIQADMQDLSVSTCADYVDTSTQLVEEFFPLASQNIDIAEVEADITKVSSFALKENGNVITAGSCVNPSDSSLPDSNVNLGNCIPHHRVTQSSCDELCGANMDFCSIHKDDQLSEQTEGSNTYQGDEVYGMALPPDPSLDERASILCDDDLSSGEASPGHQPCLSEEKRQLLEDALEILKPLADSGPNVKTSSILPEKCIISSEDPQPLECLEKNNYILLTELVISPQVANDELPASGSPCNHIAVTENDATNDSDIAPATMLFVKPPSTLSLRKSIADEHPQISPQSPISPYSTQSETSVVQSSTKLEGPSYSASKMIRCESAPTLSSQYHTASVLTSSSILFSGAELSHHFKTAMSPVDFDKRVFNCHSPLHKLRKAPVVTNPYMSPLLASDELLKGLTKVCIVGCHLDPLLDDSVSFARRLRNLDVPVELHLIDDLPHGFLNFALISYEAKKASDFCGKKIAELLQSTGV